LAKRALFINPIFVKQKARIRNKNVVVLNFEGVIGDFFKKNLIDISCPGFYIRPEAIPALRRLQDRF
jgi:hypothetical protein